MISFTGMKEIPTIFLVDDDDDDRFFIREALEKIVTQIKVLEFTNGPDFLHKVMQTGVDLSTCLVLLDINMPMMSGLEVIVKLKSYQKFKGLSVLVLSTATHPKVIEDSIAAGASGYFVKPSSPSGLHQLASDVMKYFTSELPG